MVASVGSPATSMTLLLRSVVMILHLCSERIRPEDVMCDNKVNEAGRDILTDIPH